MSLFVALLALALATSPASPQASSTADTYAQPAAPAADALLAADQRFSTGGIELALVDSLARMFDDEVVMPLPNGGFAVGKHAVVAAIRANPVNATTRANWTPIRAGVSGDGQHGFTYGFMTMFQDGKEIGRAKYLSYWIKRGKGWRVAAFKRARSPQGNVSMDRRAPALPSRIVRPSNSPAVIETYRRSLAVAEEAFSQRAQLIGLGPAFVEFGSADAMNMGGGADFTFGNEAIGRGMEPNGGKSPVHWAPDQGVLVASSGDLGITFGFIHRNDSTPAGESRPIPFFTIWRRPHPEQPWRYVAE